MSKFFNDWLTGRFMAAGGAAPAGYTRLTRIKAEQSQYITLATSSYIADPRFYVKAMRTGNTYQYGNMVISHTQNNLWLVMRTYKGIMIDYKNSQTNTQVEPTIDQLFEISYGITDTANLYINNTPYEFTKGTKDTAGDLRLFCLASNTGNANYKFYGWVYQVDIYNGNTPLFQLLPYLRNQDNVAGLYDSVTRTFFPSESGTDFIAGEVYTNE